MMKETLNKMLILILLIGVVTGCAAWRDREREGATDRGAGSTARTDDAALTAKVKAKLLSDERVEGTQIDVDTQNGIVFLNGVVETEEQKRKAIDLARNTEGVRDVEDNLKVGQIEGSSLKESGKESGRALPVNILEDLG
jgi:osmotically-inducible protein OsmY